MRHHRLRISRTIAVALTAITAGAVLSALALGLSGWPQTRAIAASFTGPVMLGVDADTAVTLGPEVAADVKFESAEETSVPAHEERALLLVGTAKSVAPMAIAAKPAKRITAAKPIVRRSAVRSRAAGGWSSARVSWYGPGFYGNTMAGGGTLQPGSMVAAHRSLPFGTRIEFRYRGRSCVATVMDRGPYVGGRTFDLGPGTAKALGFSGVGTVQYKIIGR